MKIFAIPRKTAVQIVVSLIVIAALLRHDYPKTGLVVSLCSVGFYLILTARRKAGYLLNFAQVDARRRTLAVTGAVMLYVLIRGAFTGSTYNVLLLIALGIDYFIYDQHDRRKGTWLDG